ncbi:MAG: DUF434 domain-containing protein [Candidatus Methanogasteraceae archaeon]
MTDRESVMHRAAQDIRHLLLRGYPRTGAIRFVCDHYRLADRNRHILMRVVIEPGIAKSRFGKKMPFADIRGKDLVVDGYNVITATESIVSGEPVFLCDDGFIRDIRGVFRNYRNPDRGVCRQILEIISEHEPNSVIFLFDSQISKSGVLARHIREMLHEYSISGDARTSRHVDFDLKHCDSVVATGDGPVIDGVVSVVDIPDCVLTRLGRDADRIEDS